MIKKSGGKVSRICEMKLTPVYVHDRTNFDKVLIAKTRKKPRFLAKIYLRQILSPPCERQTEQVTGARISRICVLPIVHCDLWDPPYTERVFLGQTLKFTRNACLRRTATGVVRLPVTHTHTHTRRTQ